MNLTPYLWVVFALSGCQNHTETPPGPCQLPPTTHFIGPQQFQSPGARTYDRQDQCLAQGGTYHASGRGILADQMRLAAQHGDTDAWLQLGRWAEHDQPPRFDDARDAYRTAYRLGHASGAWHLGRMAEHGMGQTIDPVAALGWYQKAAGGVRLVKASELAQARRQQTQLQQQLNDQQLALLQGQAQLDAHKTLLDASTSPLYRFDIGAPATRCGQAMNWRDLGDSMAGFALALKQFDQHYADQGWLWLRGDQAPDWARDPLMPSVLAEFMQTRRTAVALGGYWADLKPDNMGVQPWLVMDDPGGVHRAGHLRVRFDCAL